LVPGIIHILRTGGTVLSLVLISLGLGLSVNALRTDARTMELWPEYLAPGRWRYVSLAQAARLHAQREQRVVFVDARPARVYCRGHIAGALSLHPRRVRRADPGPPPGTHPNGVDVLALTYPCLKKLLPLAGPIVVYGQTRSHHLAALLAWRLARRGHQGVLVLKARFRDWLRAGWPTGRRGCTSRGRSWAGAK
jgi:3-mercaptopyruvate sulfurtransferase SseA